MKPKNTTRRARGERTEGTRRRRIEPTVSTTMRLRSSIRKDLEAWAERARRSVSELAQELIEEGIRMRECPGIYFATEPSGRTAKIAGTGLGVWEVLRDVVKGQDAARVRKAFPQLSQSQVTAALLYYNRFPEEIQREVEANAALTPEVIERRYPGLVQTVRAG